MGAARIFSTPLSLECKGFFEREYAGAGAIFSCVPMVASFSCGAQSAIAAAAELPARFRNDAQGLVPAWFDPRNRPPLRNAAKLE
jgi:hypothetical protein